MTINQNLFEVLKPYFPADENSSFLIDPTGFSLTYKEMQLQSAQLANYFTHCGLQMGDAVAVQLQKSPYALLVYLACIRAGLVYLPLNSAYQLAELAYFMTDAEPALILVDSLDAVMLQPLLDGTHIQLETLSVDGAGSLLGKARQFSGEFESVHCCADQLAAILYTSGTTGRPKGAMLTHRNLSASALMLKDYWQWTEQDVLLHSLPIFHVHGLFVACHCVLAAGASMIFLPSFNVQQVLYYLPDSTVMMGVPTYYTRLLAEPSFGTEHCRNIRLFISGSAPLLAQTHREFESRTGQKILERYGMSETNMLTSNPLAGERRAGTVGPALPSVELRVVNTDHEPIAVNEVGSIEVKGANVFKGYWRMPEKTLQEFTEDGFFITGDQGRLSEDGYLTIVGRSKDMIISGGFNVYPKEVELVIDDVDGVKESAVFGVADHDWGEAVVAAVVVDDDSVEADGLIANLKQRLASYKIPKRIYFVNQLPRNTMAKVQKNKLRELYSSI